MHLWKESVGLSVVVYNVWVVHDLFTVHHILVGLRYDRNQKVKHDDNNDELIQKPNKPDDSQDIFVVTNNVIGKVWIIDISNWVLPNVHSHC